MAQCFQLDALSAARWKHDPSNRRIIARPLAREQGSAYSSRAIRAVLLSLVLSLSLSLAFSLRCAIISARSHRLFSLARCRAPLLCIYFSRRLPGARARSSLYVQSPFQVSGEKRQRSGVRQQHSERWTFRSSEQRGASAGRRLVFTPGHFVARF